MNRPESSAAFIFSRARFARFSVAFVLLLLSAESMASTPDLSGVWTNSSLTGLTRPPQIDGLVIDPEQAEHLASTNFHNVRAAADEELSDPNKAAPEVLERLPSVGNYNAYWVEPGTRYGVVDGEIRSSWIIDPADGQIPFTAAALAMFEQQRAQRQSMAGPEVLSVGERCLLGFGGTGGPPMLNVLYNNYYRFLQTPEHLLILVEMVHDARIVRLGGQHGPSSRQHWLGDSVGHFEGDTLVVSTTHFHPERAVSGPLPLSSNAVVEERFRRESEDVLYYAFRIDDPVLYTQPVRGEMSFRRRDEQVFEYACHEGNYAMPAMLKGARMLEAESASQD